MNSDVHFFFYFQIKQKVEVYQSVEGVPTIEGYPMPSLPDQVYTYPNMPDKLWKKYRCAYRLASCIVICVKLRDLKKKQNPINQSH